MTSRCVSCPSVYTLSCSAHLRTGAARVYGFFPALPVSIPIGDSDFPILTDITASVFHPSPLWDSSILLGKQSFTRGYAPFSDVALTNIDVQVFIEPLSSAASLQIGIFIDSQPRGVLQICNPFGPTPYGFVSKHTLALPIGPSQVVSFAWHLESSAPVSVGGFTIGFLN